MLIIGFPPKVIKKGDDNMYKDLSHLSDEEIQTLMDRYYNKGEDAQELIKEYNLYVIPSRFTRLFPPEKIEETCEYCDTNLVQPRYSRNAKLKNPKFIKCPICGHRPRLDGKCKCENCEKSRMMVRYTDRRFRINPKGSPKQRALIEAMYPIEAPTKEYNELNIAHRVILAVLCKDYLTDELKIGPLRNSIHRYMTHNISVCYELLDELLDEEILLVDPCSSVYAFPKENFPKVYSMGRVTYRINLKLPSDSELSRHILLYPDLKIRNEEDVRAGKWLEDRLSYDEFVEMMVWEYQIYDDDDKDKFKALEYIFNRVKCNGGLGKLLQFMRFVTVFLGKDEIKNIVLENNHDEIDNLITTCEKGIEVMRSNGYNVNIRCNERLIGPSKILEYYLENVLHQSIEDFCMSQLNV